MAEKATPTILSGGNPQIPKGDGDGPVQDDIAAMPGWRSDVGRRIDALIVRTIPEVVKAVRWNTPFYGVEGRGQLLSFSLDLVEEDGLDEEQLTSWVEQSSGLPGASMF